MDTAENNLRAYQRYIKIVRHFQLSLSRQTGQAATEFVIAAVCVLVPLFVMIPLLGKYIDIKHAAIQQAHYEAWEYTAWFGTPNDVMYGINDTERADVKDFAITRQEGLHYFFSNPHAPGYGQMGQENEMNPLWVDQRGDSLFGVLLPTPEIEGELNYHFGIPGIKLLDGFMKSLQSGFKMIGDLLANVFAYMGGSPARFDAINLNGYYKSEVNFKVRSIDDIFPEMTLTSMTDKTDKPLEFYTRAAVMTNNWNAGSREQAIIESRGLVVTTLFSPISNIFSFVKTKLSQALDWFNNNALGYLHLIPEVDVGIPGMPAFGYVAEDLVPYEHLQNEAGKAPKKLTQQKIKSVELDPEKLKEVKTPLDLIKDYKVPIYYYEEVKE